MKICCVVCGLLALTVLSSNGQPAPEDCSDILGCQRVQLAAGWHLLGPPFEPFAVAQGVISGVQTNRLSVTGGAGWVRNQWNGYEVLIVSGAATGQRYIVSGNAAGVLELSSDPRSAGVSVGDAYELAPTLEEYLGSQLNGVSSPTNADWAATYSGGQMALLYRTPAGQWLDEQGQPALLSVISGQGFWINPAVPRALLLVGRYRGDLGGTWISPGPQAISFPFNRVPVTLSSVNWLGAAANKIPAQSDQFGVWNDATATFRSMWLDAATGQWEWQDTGEAAGGLTLAGGQGYLYLHAGNGFYLRWR